MNKCILIPKADMDTAVKSMNHDYGADYFLCHMKNDIHGIFIRSMQDEYCNSQETRALLQPYLQAMHYNINGASAIFYTPADFYIVVWGDIDAKKSKTHLFNMRQ